MFVLSTLQQIEPVAGQVAALVLCHTRELAYQVGHSFLMSGWACQDADPSWIHHDMLNSQSQFFTISDTLFHVSIKDYLIGGSSGMQSLMEEKVVCCRSAMSLRGSAPTSLTSRWQCSMVV